jgi:hypothetical protein
LADPLAWKIAAMPGLDLFPVILLGVFLIAVSLGISTRFGSYHRKIWTKIDYFGRALGALGMVLILGTLVYALMAGYAFDPMIDNYNKTIMR